MGLHSPDDNKPETQRTVGDDGGTDGQSRCRPNARHHLPLKWWVIMPALNAVAADTVFECSFGSIKINALESAQAAIDVLPAPCSTVNVSTSMYEPGVLFWGPSKLRNQTDCLECVDAIRNLSGYSLPLLCAPYYVTEFWRFEGSDGPTNTNFGGIDYGPPYYPPFGLEFDSLSESQAWHSTLYGATLPSMWVMRVADINPNGYYLSKHEGYPYYPYVSTARFFRSTR